MTLIQIPDTINSDLSLICGYTFNEPELSANEFVIVEDCASHRNGQTDQETTWIEGVNADFYYLGEESTAFQGTPIAIPASEFDPAVLAAVMYYPPNETNSREEFETLLEEFDDERQAEHNGNDRVIWTLRDFFQWVTSNNDRNWQPPAHTGDRFAGRQRSTYDAMVKKMLRRNRRPAWVDGGLPIRPTANSSGARGRRPSQSAAMLGLEQTPQQPQWFDPTNLLQPGRALVIRVGQAGGGRDYGLFLNYMLKRVYDLKEQRQITFPVLHHIDEAQDLFNGSKQFASAIGNVLSEGVRKGRSRQKMAHMNNLAKSKRIMLTDISEILTFVKF
jgi:hypothetical protein